MDVMLTKRARTVAHRWISDPMRERIDSSAPPQLTPDQALAEALAELRGQDDIIPCRLRHRRVVAASS